MSPILSPILLGALTFASPASPEAAPKVFATAEEAAQAFVDASERQDTAALESILGPEGDSLINSGDAVQDAARRARLVGRAKEHLGVEKDAFHSGRYIIAIGKDSWPLPLPLLKVEGGYRFDAGEAKAEILARRVGHNELNTIAALRDLVEAEREFAYLDVNKDGSHVYAQQLLSDPGKRTGLFWEVAEGEPDSPLGALVRRAEAEGYGPPAAGQPPIYHGYVFRILKGQGPNAPGGALDYVVRGNMMGGFAIVASPAEYGVSGVKTFLVAHDGVVLEKDLGARTTALVSAMTLYNPDKTWIEAPKEPLEEP